MRAPTASLPPVPAVRVVFAPSDTRKLANRFFGLAESEIAAKCWNSAFDQAYHDRAPRIVPAWVPARMRGEYLKGWDCGDDARETVDMEAEIARLAEYDSTTTYLPWDDLDPAELAEFGCTIGRVEVRD